MQPFKELADLVQGIAEHPAIPYQRLFKLLPELFNPYLADWRSNLRGASKSLRKARALFRVRLTLSMMGIYPHTQHHTPATLGLTSPIT